MTNDSMGEPGTGSGISGVGSTGSGIGDRDADTTSSDVGGKFGLDVDFGIFGKAEPSVSLGEISGLAEALGFDIKSEMFGPISGRTSFDKTLGLQIDNPYAQARDFFNIVVTVANLFAPVPLALALTAAKKAVSYLEIPTTLSIEEYVDTLFGLWSKAKDINDPGAEDAKKVIQLIDMLLQTTTDGAVNFADILDILEPPDPVKKPIFRRRSNIIGTGRMGLTIE